MPISATFAGSRRTATRRHARRDLLEQFQPFRADAVFVNGKSGGVAAGLRQACNEAGPDRISDLHEHDGKVLVACNKSPVVELPTVRMTSQASATNSAACLRTRSASLALHRMSM